MNFLSVLYAKAGITVDGVTTLNNTATALTPTTSDNSTNIATTAFVKNQNYYPYPTGTTSQYVRGDGSLATFPSVAAEAQRLITEVYNETGATLTKGTVVYINGGHGNLPTVTKALATSDATSAQTYGVVQNDITDNNNGFVVVIGSITDIPTNTYLNGTILYLSPITAGEWTSTKPYAPQHIVYVGIVTRSHPTQGVVEVRVQNGYEMDELHNVSAQSPANGDILQFNFSTQLWTKTTGNTTAIAEGTNLYFTDARARAAISLTTTGTSGAATYVGGVLNIPQYQAALTNPVTGTGTTNFLPKFTGASALGNSNIQDSGSLVSIGVSTLINTGTANQNTKIFGNKIGMSRTSDAAEVVYFSKNTDLGAQGTANINGYDGIQFRTQGTETVKAVITSAGNVGIGTSSPASILETIGQVTINAASSGAGIGKLQLKGAKSDGNGFNLSFDNSTNIASINLFYNGAFTFGNANTERMRIAPTSGNLLLNTTTDAGYKLDVNGTARVSGAATFSSSVTAETTVGQIRITPTGWRDIDRATILIRTKTNNPAEIDLQNTISGANYGWQFSSRETTTPDLYLFSNSNGGFQTKLLLKFNGNLLIGTTTDAGYKLDVNGTARATDFYTSGWFRNSAGNKGLYNSAYNTHLYSRAAGIWSIASSNSTLGYLELWYGYYDEGGAAIKGSLAWNSAGFGLLNDQQSEYSVLCYQGASYGGTLRGGWNIDGANLSINPNATFEYAQITYSSSLDPNSYNWYSGMEYDPTADETYYYIRYIDGNQFRVYPDGTIYINGGVFSQYTATSNYISVGAYGLYSSTYSAYFRRNDASSYAAWELVGAKGGYTGMYYSASNQPHIMFNTSNGNGGLYYQTNSRWILYYDYGNNCLAVGGTTTNATYKMYVTGAIYATGAIVANSDGRNKENVEVVENALEKVNNLRGVTYTKKDQDSGKREMGVIAQEVLPHVPEVVQYAEDLDQYGVSYGNFAGLFIEAIKEQQVLINELKAKIEILENK